MRVVVDPDLCQLHAMCEVEAPDVFAVPKDGVVAIVGDVTEANVAAVRKAVRYCPTGALRLEQS